MGQVVEWPTRRRSHAAREQTVGADESTSGDTGLRTLVFGSGASFAIEREASAKGAGTGVLDASR
jgi:hypothetical protein